MPKSLDFSTAIRIMSVTKTKGATDMASLLLCIIYIGFISLGLPDGLLGAAWPIMHEDIAAPLSFAGIVSLIITAGTIISSLLSDRLTHRFGAGLVTAVSAAMTAAALFGFSVSNAAWQLCLLALPYGLGAGAVDAALNNYVALHYKARHMSWLHCFWGVGASVGPYIMGAFLARPQSWPAGYRCVSFIQIALTAFLLLSLPLWTKRAEATGTQSDATPIGIKAAMKLRGVKEIMIAFGAYGAAEMTAMVWSATYFTEYRGFPADTAATVASLFYLGMMVGRLISGFIAEKLSDSNLIRVGIAVATVGFILIALPLPTDVVAVIGLFLFGLGCAPIYPSIIHSTPLHFSAAYSQSVIGMEMASAYVGSCLMSPLFGLIANHLSAGWFPVFIVFFFILLTVMSERLNKRCPIH